MKTLALGLTLVILGISSIFTLATFLVLWFGAAGNTPDSITNLLFYLAMTFTSYVQYKGLTE